MLDINTIVYKLPIEVNSTKLLDELDNLVLPCYDKDIKNDLMSIGATNISVTGLSNTPLDNWYSTEYNRAMSKMVDLDTNEELTKNYANFTLGFDGAWRNNLEARYDNNVSDRDFTHWHPNLIGSEIFNLKNRIAKHLQISDQLRCRASFIYGYRKMNFHADPHTPWRVHVNLKSGPGTRWFFRTLDPMKTIEWVQPPDSVWLVRTGNVQHSVEIQKDETRWQLFYHIWQSNLGPNYHQIA
jgi:hypothetical protein